MAAFKKIAIVGAAGNLGHCILQALIDSDYDVTVITRAESTSVFQGVPEQNIIRGEYTVDFFRKALSGQDALVLAIGSGALGTQKEIIEAAAEVGVKRVIPSEFGSASTPQLPSLSSCIYVDSELTLRAQDVSNPASLKAIPFNEEKKVIADHLEKVVAASPQTTWTAVVSGPFFDWCLEYNLFGCDVSTHQATLYDQGQTRFDATNISTVANAVAKILSMPEKFQNQRLLISGMAVTQAEILAAFQKATAGGKEWAVSYRTADSLRQEGYEKVAKNDFSGVLDVIGSSLFEAGHGSYYSADGGNVVNELLGVKDDLYQTVETYVNTQLAKE